MKEKNCPLSKCRKLDGVHEINALALVVFVSLTILWDYPHGTLEATMGLSTTATSYCRRSHNPKERALQLFGMDYSAQDCLCLGYTNIHYSCLSWPIELGEPDLPSQTYIHALCS